MEKPLFLPLTPTGIRWVVKTSIGMWKVAYNAENRPVIFTKMEENADQWNIWISSFQRAF